MAFFLWCTFMTFLGRKLGWEVSKLLYQFGLFSCVVFCIVWGIVNGQGVHQLIKTWHPGLLLKIYGYGAGAYVAIPNYELFDESTLSEELRMRGGIIAFISVVSYVLTSVAFAFAAK
jgi:hypothetical protein